MREGLLRSLGLVGVLALTSVGAEAAFPYWNSGDNTDGFVHGFGDAFYTVTPNGLKGEQSSGWWKLPCAATGEFRISVEVYADAGDADGHLILLNGDSTEGYGCRFSPSSTDTPVILISRGQNFASRPDFFFPSTILAQAGTLHFPLRQWTQVTVVRKPDRIILNVGGQEIEAAVVPAAASHTSVGLGYYASRLISGSGQIFFRNIRIESLDTEPPTLEIASPPDGITFSGNLAFSGTASDASGIASVQWRVDGGSWQSAAGTTAWSFTLPQLSDGPHSVEVLATEASAQAFQTSVFRNVTADNTMPLISDLTASASRSSSMINWTTNEASTSRVRYGIGMLSDDTGTVELNVTSHEVVLTGLEANTTYDYEVISVDSSGNTATLSGSFTTQNGPPTPGSYYGLIEGPGFATSGWFQLVETSRGTITGTLVIGGQNYSFRGKFDPEGVLVTSISKRNHPSWVLRLERAVIDEVNTVTGTLFDGAGAATLRAVQRIYDARASAAPHEGKYTLLILPSAAESGEGFPAGIGAVSMRISAKGQARFTGVLGDGTRVVFSSAVVDTEEIPIFLLLYRAAGQFSTWLITEGDELSADSVVWTKPAHARDIFFPNGFEAHPEIEGSRYQAPLFPQRVIGLANVAGNAWIAFEEGNLSSPVERLITVDHDQKVSVLDDEPLKLNVEAASGLMKGQFRHPVSGRLTSFYGAVDQASGRGGGAFVGVNLAGSMEFGANPDFGTGPVSGNGSKKLPGITIKWPRNKQMLPNGAPWITVVGTASTRAGGSIEAVEYQVLGPDGTLSAPATAIGETSWQFVVNLAGPGVYRVFAKARESGTQNESGIAESKFVVLP